MGSRRSSAPITTSAFIPRGRRGRSTRGRCPRPPIIIGGRAHPGTANVAARFADEYNTLMVGPEKFAVRAGRLREACERVDRDPSTMRLSLMTGCILGRDRVDLLERARRLYG